MSLLDQKKVASTREKIRDLIERGGPEKVKKEISEIEKAVQIVTGKALPSDFNSNSRSGMESVSGAGSKTVTNVNSKEKKTMKVKLGDIGSAPSRKVDSPTKFITNPSRKIQHRKGVESKEVLPDENPDWSNDKVLDDLGANDSKPHQNFKNEKELLQDQKGRLLLKSKINAPPNRRVEPPSINATGHISSSSPQSTSLPLPPPPSNPPPKPKAFETFKALALYDNDADDEDELSFQKGDIIVVIGEEEGGEWWQAENETKKRGVVPAVFFKVLNRK